MPWTEQDYVEGEEEQDIVTIDAFDTKQAKASVNRLRVGSTLFSGGENAAADATRSHSVWNAHDKRAGPGSKVSMKRRAGPTQVDVMQMDPETQSMSHQRRAAQPAKMDEVLRLEKVAQLLQKREKRNSQYLH